MARTYTIDVDVPKVVTIGIVSVLLLVVILVGTQGYFLKFQHEEFAAKNFNAPNPLLEQVNRASAERMHAYRWVNPERTAVAIPIDSAIAAMAASKGRPPTTQPLGGGM
jgi:hypothetical protein